MNERTNTTEYAELLNIICDFAADFSKVWSAPDKVLLRDVERAVDKYVERVLATNYVDPR